MKVSKMKLLVLGLLTVTSVYSYGEYKIAKANLLTEWGEKITPENAWREYPRPQMVRDNWENLNGLWKYVVTDHGTLSPFNPNAPTNWTGEILVPFVIESALSGVGNGKLLEPHQTLWYTRTFKASPKKGMRTILNFEQVDFRAMVFVNGVEAGVPHEGGQIPFSYDITDLVKEGENTILVSVWDPTEKFINTYGKQSFKPKGCFYTRSSGIGGTVWLETVPKTYITDYRVTTDCDKGTVSVKVSGVGDIMNSDVKIVVTKDGKRVAKGEVKTWGEAVEMKLAGDIKLWSFNDPQLYNLEITMEDDEADTKDVVKGYFGMRKIERRKDAAGFWKFYVNNKPCFLLGPLDQGWWPDGLLTPPSDDAMKFDIMTLKKMGYNCMRKHIKVEPRRYYYLCDTLGLMVIQDMPSLNRAFGWGDRNKAYGMYRRELKEMMDLLYNVPSIVMWCPYNENWGQPNAYLTVSTLNWVKQYDKTRLLNGPSGWNDYQGGTTYSIDNYTWNKSKEVPSLCDTIDLHDYEPFPKPQNFTNCTYRAVFLGEFGGIGARVQGHLWTEKAWGYNGSNNADTSASEKKFINLMTYLADEKVNKTLAGAIYTQTTDVEAEINGLMTYDRKVIKFNTEKVNEVHQKIYKATEK